MTRFLLTILLPLVLAGQPMPPFSRQYIEPKPFDAAENERLLKLFEGLRVADVNDGLDIVGLPDVMTMSPDILPMWRDEKDFRHRITGFAVTLRIVPAQARTPDFPSHEEFAKWEGRWYSQLTPEEFARWLSPGAVLVIDAQGTRDSGFCGSNNALNWYSRGMRGIVTSGGCRDSDENILQRIPIYQRQHTRGINPGRVQIESYNRPVTVGSVLVMPGDIIVADSDGVVVVPRAKAEAVAAAARKILEGDKKARRSLYEKMGRPLDPTVK
ncbi:MAG: RraA family protein [Bryobacteraceae bacterium]|nr:RraA family protein [Bryobacteraceae bacterium]